MANLRGGAGAHERVKSPSWIKTRRDDKFLMTLTKKLNTMGQNADREPSNVVLKGMNFEREILLLVQNFVYWSLASEHQLKKSVMHYAQSPNRCISDLLSMYFFQFT